MAFSIISALRSRNLQRRLLHDDLLKNVQTKHSYTPKPTRNHKNLDAGRLTLADGIGGLVPWRIHNGTNTDKHQIRKRKVVPVRIEHLVRVVVEMQVSKADNSSAVLSVRLVGGLENEIIKIWV